MNSSNKLCFQFAVENVRKTLDAQKAEIEKWAKENPILLEVRFKNLKSQLDALGAVFGKNNPQLVSLGKEVERTFENARKGAKSTVQDMSKMTTATREMAEAAYTLTKSEEEAVRLIAKRDRILGRIAANEKNIAEYNKRITELGIQYIDHGGNQVPIINSYKKQVEDWKQQNKQYTEEVDKLSQKFRDLVTLHKNSSETFGNLAKLTESTTTQQRYNAVLADTEKLLERINNAINAGGNKKILDVAARDLIDFQNRAAGLAKYKDDPNIVANLITEYTRLSKIYGSVTTEQEKMIKASDAATAKEEKNIQAEIAARQRATQAIRTQAEALLNARRETLRSQATDLGKLLTLGEKGLGVEQYNHVRDALRAIRQELREIDTITQRGGHNTGLLLALGSNTRDYSHIINTAQQYANIRVQGEHDIANAVHHTTTALSQQSQVLSDLRTMAYQYVSVWAAKSFIDNLIEQGGQLEQQRLSIGAILQDVAHANELFGKIKSLAIISPFGVTELDAMTKQLSAYGFKYNELYDMTKRLADISAATGTEVSRLALALGHVRSEGALSGYTLRQFAMGNIPMLEKLSQKIGVTAKEIRKMVSKKEIGYDQVLEVMKELTDEGGMFYNAQETMAQALNAKFKNLRDSFQIMYSEMAEGAPGDFLKGVAETLTSMSKNWKVLMPMITAGAGALGIWKATTMALNHELARQEMYLGKNAIATSKYSMSQLRAIATTGRWSLALRGLGAAMRSMGRFIFSPVTLGFAAVEGLIYLWQKHNQEVEKAKELTSGISLTGSEGERNIKERMSGIEAYRKGMSENELKQGIETMTLALKDYGRGLNVGKTLEEAFGTDANGKVKSLAEQYEFLRGKMEDTLEVYKELQRTADSFEFGINYTSSWWGDDNVETDLTDYANAVKKFEDAVTSLTASNKDVVKAAVESAQQHSDAYREATKDMKSYSDMLKELYNNYEKYGEAFGYARGVFLEKGLAYDEGQVFGSFFKINAQKNEAMDELDKFMDGVEEKLGYDMENLSKTQVNTLLKNTHDWLEKHPEWNNIIDVIREKIEVRWPIKLEPDKEDTPKELNEWQKQMQDWLDKHGSKLKIKPDMSRDDIVKMVHNSIKDTQEVIDQTKPILLRFGVDLSNIPEELPLGLRTPWGKKQAADYTPAANENKTDKDFIKEFGLPNPKEKGSGKKEDKALKAAKTRLDETKAFLSDYKKYRDAYGKDRAISILEDLFPTTKGRGQQIVDNFKSVLEQIKNSINLNTEDRKKFGISVDKLIADTNLSEAKEKIDRQMRQIESLISQSAESFNLYETLFEKTGNKDFAMSAFSNGQVWDDAAEDLAQTLIEKMGGKTIIDWGADEQAAEDWFKKNFNNGNELFKLWKQIVDIISRNYKKVLNDGADAISHQLSFAEKMKKVEEEILELQKKRANTSDTNLQASYDRQIQEKTIELGKLNSDAFKESLDYLRFFGASLNMANSEVQRIGTSIKDQLSKELSRGTITAADYSRTLKEVNKRMKESRNAFKGDFMTFLTGGQQALVEKRQSAVDDAAIKIAQAEKERQEAVARGDEESAAAAETRRKEAEKEKENALKALGISSTQYDTLKSMLTVVNIIQGAFEGMLQAAQSLAEMFDALGEESAANRWSDIAGYIKGISSIFAPVNNLLQNALNGNVSGVVSSVISAPFQMITGPITAFAQLYDKNHERRIQELKREVTKIDNTLNTIKSLRERELGYDRGTLRSQLVSLYKAQERNISLFGSKMSITPAQSGMVEYYGRYSGGNGYSQEYNALVETRKKYMEMYDEENAKKKKSQEALEEYKVKIAELDEEIMYFVQDLAKDLWSIDIQGWASQISDALWTAFENGEDAVKAFGETAKDIVSSVAKNMMSLHVIEPIFKKLENSLFGEGGAIKYDSNGNIDMYASEQPVLEILGKFFGSGGEMEKSVEAAEMFYNWVEKITGMDLSSDENKTGVSTSIKNITESTGDLLASYFNATRASVSKIEMMDAEYYPMYLQLITSCNLALTTLQARAKEIADSNAAIERNTKTMADLMSGLKNKTWRVPIA